MHTIALVNPNTSAATLERMLALARPLLPPGFALIGAVAEHGPSMIVDEAGLALAAGEVVRLGVSLASRCQGFVVAAFGGPGVEMLHSVTGRPVVGLGEAAMRAAAARGRFGVVTTTPALADSIARQASALAAEGQFTGVRLSTGDPLQLAADPALQLARLCEAVERCLRDDGAASVVIGGGPLSDTGRALRELYGDVIIEPVPAAMRHIVAALGGRSTQPVT
jgi:Asp/Glu/hydantoin racemase